MRLAFIPAAVVAALIATAAQAAPYTILVYEPAQVLKDRLEKTESAQAYWTAYTRFASQLAVQNALRGGAAVASDPAATSTGQPLLSGYFQVEAADDEAARQLAALVPLAAGGHTEVRKELPNPTMAQH